MHYTCEKCGEKFTRSYNLVRHEKQACGGRRVGDQVAKRPRVADGRTSPDMQKCDVCDVMVSQSGVLAHERSLEHRNRSCVPFCEGVQIIESAFRSRIVSYRVTGHGHHVNYTVFFNEIKVKVLNLIREILLTQRSLKINMETFGRYVLPTQDIHSVKSFNTANKIVNVGSDLDTIYGSFVETMKVQAADFQEKDSGMFTNIIEKSRFFYY